MHIDADVAELATATGHPRGPRTNPRTHHRARSLVAARLHPPLGATREWLDQAPAGRRQETHVFPLRGSDAPLRKATTTVRWRHPRPPRFSPGVLWAQAKRWQNAHIGWAETGSAAPNDVVRMPDRRAASRMVGPAPAKSGVERSPDGGRVGCQSAKLTPSSVAHPLIGIRTPTPPRSDGSGTPKACWVPLLAVTRFYTGARHILRDDSI